jgi:hypothetical protein
MSAERSDTPSLTRNSGIREMTARPRRFVAGKINDLTPITANQLSFMGTTGVLAGGVMATSQQESILEDPRVGLASLLVIGIASAVDGIDGEVGRLQKNNPDKADSTNGQLVDVLNDRGQESGMAGLRYFAAKRRGDHIGKATALGAYITNFAPSIVRAGSEALGHPVPETGTGVVELMGTRIGRAGISMIATVFPKTQAPLDTLTTVANTITTIKRVRSIIENRNTPPTLSPEIQKEGRERVRALATAAGVAVATIIFTDKNLQDH